MAIDKAILPGMSIFPKATPSQPARTKDSRTIALFLALIFAVLAISQLAMFQSFPLLIESFWLPGGRNVAYTLAAVIVVCELLAIPFLLRLKLSPGFRVFSMFLGWLTSAIWLFLSIWLVFSDNAVTNVGLFGSSVTLAPGWWTVLFGFALCILMTWATWGLWPFKRKIAAMTSKP